LASGYQVSEIVIRRQGRIAIRRFSDKSEDGRREATGGIAMEFCGCARTNGLTPEGVSYRSSHYGLADIKSQRYMGRKGHLRATVDLGGVSCRRNIGGIE
jgi:hypothetical protein